MFLCGEKEGRKPMMLTCSDAAEEDVKRNIWRSSEGRRSGGRRKLQASKSRRGKISRPSRGVCPEVRLYLSTVAWEGQEGRAFCPRSRCPGSSYWGWTSLTWRTFQTHREDRMSLPDRQNGIFCAFLKNHLKGNVKFRSSFFVVFSL